MSSHKIERINSEVAQTISNILALESRDELLKSVTITGADVTKDLSFAKVYFTSLLDMKKEQIEKEVNEAALFVRKRLSDEINLRHTPELRFIYDESIEYGKKIEDIISHLD